MARKTLKTKAKKSKIKTPVKTKKSNARILVVDDHPIIRQGLTQLINREDDIVVCEQVENAHQALLAIKKTRPDMVVVDISLRQERPGTHEGYKGPVSRHGDFGSFHAR